MTTEPTFPEVGGLTASLLTLERSPEVTDGAEETGCRVSKGFGWVCGMAVLVSCYDCCKARG